MGLKLRPLIKQAGKFLAVSGSGWLIDFGIFWALTRYINLAVVYANMLSSIPAITLVFLVSTRKIFSTSKGRIPLIGKYAIYFAYQMILVFCVSWVGEGLYQWFCAMKIMLLPIIDANIKILCKILITPITMTCNFIVMKLLCERL